MGADAAARLDYLADTVDLLWPAAGPGSTPMIVLPSERTPRLLAPVRPRRAAASALVRYTAQQGVRDRAAALALAGAVGLGLGRFRPPVSASAAATGGESIDDLLTSLLGEPVVTSLALTRPRPNRKPVLQAFDRRGRTIAFVKIGVTGLARRLVDAEAAALQVLAEARLSELRTPQVLHHRQWRELSVLVTSALPLGRRAPHPVAGEADELTAAMREVSEIGQPCDGAAYIADLRDRAAALPQGADRWTALVDQALATHDTAGLRFGSWHGDWTEWNCARHGGRLVVWDWERFTAPAPQGLDLLHYVLNTALGPQRVNFPALVRTLIDDAPELLRPWRGTPADARAIATLYVTDLALRYLADSADSTEAVHRVEQWAIPAITGALRTNPRGAASW